MENRALDSEFDEQGGEETDTKHENGAQAESQSTEYIEMEANEFSPFSPSQEEKAFFEAVRSGDKTAVEELINDKGVDVDCTNVNGETALQIAVKREAFDMVQMLLRYKAEIGPALFQAVRSDSLQCVRILVAHDSSHRKGTAIKTFQRHSPTKLRSCSGKFDEFLTPLVLAVLKGNYEIVEFFVSKGYRVEDPTTQKAQNENGSMVRLKDSLVKLNTYKALASPLYISHTFLLENRDRKELTKKTSCHTANDPLYRSIVLRRKLKELGRSENEFRDDYYTLSEQCENFAVSLLDECRNLEEIAAVMDVPENVHLKQKEQKLRVLNFAIKYRNRKFIAHPYSQVMLNTVVYKGSGIWNELSFLMKFLLATSYTFFMPLCMLGYIFMPPNRLKKKMETPLCKFMSHAASVLWFLILVSMSAFQDKIDGSFLRLSPLTVVIGVWVAGMIVQEIRQARYQGVERYLGEWWHLAFIPMILGYVLSAVLWIVGYASLASYDSGASKLEDLKNIESYCFILLSNSFYSFAVLLTFFEASHLIQVDSNLGPLHLSLMMMTKDIVRFLALFALNFCAFALAMRKLYSQYAQTSHHVSESSNATSSESSNGNTTHSFQSIEGTAEILFWALFGHVEFSAFNTSDSAITKVTGQLLFAAYSLASILVVLNLLIAMLNNSYKKVDKEKDTKFKFARTRIWMYYVSEESPLPAPFNLIPVETIASGVRWLTKRYGWRLSCIETREKPTDTVKTNQKRRRVVIKNLIHRYFSGKQNTLKKESNEDDPLLDPPQGTPDQNDVQIKLLEVTKTLQSLQGAVNQFRHKTKQNGTNHDIKPRN